MGTLETKLYKKPIEIKEPIHIQSNHPLQMKLNTIFSNSLRINRLCSTNIDAYKENLLLLHSLINKFNYPATEALEAIKKAKKRHTINQSLLPEKQKINNPTIKNNLRIKLTFNELTKDIQYKLKDSWKRNKSDTTENIEFCLRLNPSIKAKLVSTKRILDI